MKFKLWRHFILYIYIYQFNAIDQKCFPFLKKRKANKKNTKIYITRITFQILCDTCTYKYLKQFYGQI